MTLAELSMSVHPSSTSFQGPTILCQAVQGWPTERGHVTRCWNLWTTGKINYNDTGESDSWQWMGSFVDSQYAPHNLKWVHTDKAFREMRCTPVRRESVQEAANRILALPESDRPLALRMAWQDAYVLALLSTRSLLTAYSAMLNRACDLRAHDPRLALQGVRPSLTPTSES